MSNKLSSRAQKFRGADQLKSPFPLDAKETRWIRGSERGAKRQNGGAQCRNVGERKLK